MSKNEDTGKDSSDFAYLMLDKYYQDLEKIYESLFTLLRVVLLGIVLNGGLVGIYTESIPTKVTGENPIATDGKQSLDNSSKKFTINEEFFVVAYFIILLIPTSCAIITLGQGFRYRITQAFCNAIRINYDCAKYVPADLLGNKHFYFEKEKLLEILSKKESKYENDNFYEKYFKKYIVNNSKKTAEDTTKLQEKTQNKEKIFKYIKFLFFSSVLLFIFTHYKTIISGIIYIFSFYNFMISLLTVICSIFIIKITVLYIKLNHTNSYTKNTLNIAIRLKHVPSVIRSFFLFFSLSALALSLTPIFIFDDAKMLLSLSSIVVTFFIVHNILTYYTKTKESLEKAIVDISILQYKNVQNVEGVPNDNV